MSFDVKTQLREYAAQLSDQAPSLDELIPAPAAGSEPLPVLPSRRRWLAAVVAAVLAAATVLVVIGGVAWLTRVEPVDEPAEEPITSTTLPTETTTAEGPPPTGPAPIPASGFAVVPIDTEGVVGQSPTIVIARDGNPVLAYLGQRDVNVAVCADPACTSLRSAVTIAESQRTVSHEIGPALALLPDGSPVIAYGLPGVSSGEEPPSPDLLLTVCADPGCSTWTTTTILEEALIQRPAVMVTGEGRPIVAFQAIDSELKVATCDDATCSAFSVSTVDQGESGGSVQAASGDPPTFVYGMDGDTRLATCRAPDCGEVTITTVEGRNYWGPAIARGARGLVIATVDQGSWEEGGEGAEPLGDITVISCLDDACEERSSTVIGTAAALQLRGLALDETGHPTVAYTAEPHLDLTIVRCSDPECAGGTTSGTPVGATTNAALAIGPDGNPLLAYHTGSDLVLVRCGDPACVELPPPSPAPEALTFSQSGWTVNVAADQAVDWPGPAIAINPDGNPVIFHQVPTGLGPEGETESGPAVTTCNDPGCSRASSSDPLAIDLYFGGTFTLDGEGLPVAAFWSYDTGRMLGFARCVDATCSAATRTELVEADAWANPDIAIDSHGVPVMAYQNYTFNPGPIQVAFCADAACSSVDVVDLDFDCVDAGCERFRVHNTVSLTLTPDDRPIVVYTSSSGRTRLVVCDDPRCTGFSASTLDDTGSDSEAARAAIGPDGNPVVGYYADGTAKLAFCLDPYCEQVEVAELGDSVRGPWTPPRVAVLGDGRIAVAFAARTEGPPHLAVCSYPCSDPALMALADVTGPYTLATGADGLLLIGYIEGAESLPEPPYSVPGRLTVAKCSDAGCLGG